MYKQLLDHELAILSTPAMQETLTAVEKIANAGRDLFIYGETGTGKKFLARRYHEIANLEGNFVEVNCATDNDLTESTWFGHRRGAFTGAFQDHTGYVGHAYQGTLFADEIQHMPSGLQRKLIQFLDNGHVYKRLGENEERQAEILLAYGSNVPLREKVKEGEFRKDLHHRIAQFRVEIPSLKERKEEIYEIALQLITGLNEKYRTQLRIDPAGAGILKEYDWPGNLRQLNSVLEYICLTMEGEEIESRHIHKAIDRDKKEFDYTT